MKITCISDTHCKHLWKKLIIPSDSDVIVHAGDWTGSGTREQIANFISWFDRLPIPHKILIAGNHEKTLDDITRPVLLAKTYKAIIEASNVHYLQDSSITIDNVKFYGSPWTPWYGDPSWAFNFPQNDDWDYAKDKWDEIPLDTNVLITHGPPYGILDYATWPTHGDHHAGCPSLLKKLAELKELKLHTFGHIHESYGGRDTSLGTFINASMLNANYKASNQPITIEI